MCRAQTIALTIPLDLRSGAESDARRAGLKGLQQQLRRHQEQQQTAEQAVEKEEQQRRSGSWVRLPHIHIPSLRRQKTPAPELPSVPVSLFLRSSSCRSGG